MGKPTGFMEYQRKTDTVMPPLERIKNFDEFHEPLDKDERQKQGARCMNCGVPFCQSGMELNHMTTGCPLHNLTPEWNDEIYRDNWEQALARLLKTNNFPEFTGRICPALCECACTCGLNDSPVTVKENELTIIETGYENGWMKPHKSPVKSGKHIAVIGGGPAGLAVADRLNKHGHSVTVYERENRAGGLLTYGIPNMKLDKSVVDRRVALMKEEGVVFKTNTNIGIDVPFDDIVRNYDAVAVCCGAKKPRNLNAEGINTNGVYFAVDYLGDVTANLMGEKDKLLVNAKDKKVVVVGGGDTGVNCVETAIRQGCKSVYQLEMMPKLPDTRAENNPWPQYPRVCKVDYGHEESIAVFGHDPRIYQTTVKKVISDKKGNIKEIVTVDLDFVKDEKSGRMKPVEVEGSEKTMPCDLLLIAAGFVGCENYISEKFNLDTNERGNIKANSHATPKDKVFVAGDARRGQSLVVWAISEGRECAKEIDKYLMGYTNMV